MKALLALVTATVLVLIGCGTTGTTIGSDYPMTLNGPRAQDVTAILVLGETRSRLLAGVENGTVYLSANPGPVWTQLSSVRAGARILRLVQHPERPATFYAATDSGLFVSANAGTSWTEMPFTNPAGSPVGLRSFAIDPWNPSVMYAGTLHEGIRRSSDGGATWSTTSEGVTGSDSAEVFDIQIDLSRPDHILAAVSPFGVLASNDAGKSWNRLTAEFTTTGSAVTHVVGNSQTPPSIVYGTNSGSLRKSTDGGATWSPTRNGFAEGKINSLATVPGHPQALLAGTESGPLFSSDFGTSWTEIGRTLPRLPVTAVPSPDGALILAFGEGIGLQRSSDNGTSWSHIDENLGGSNIRLLATDQNAKNLYACLDHAVMAYDSTTNSWTSASAGLPGGTITTLVVDGDSPLHLYAATVLGAFETTSGGQLWQPLSRNMRITPGTLDPNPRIQTRVLASGTLGMDVSTDKGATWQQTKPGSNKNHVNSFTYSPRNSGLIYGAAAQAVLISRDGGFAWESSHYGLHSENITAITLDDQDANVVFAWTASGNGYRSLDGGLEWNQYAPPWSPQDRALIAFDRFDPSSVVAVVNSKLIYYSPSGGGTWFPLRPLTINVQPQSAWWNASRGILYLGTRGNGVFRVYLGDGIQDGTGERRVANSGQ